MKIKLLVDPPSDQISGTIYYNDAASTDHGPRSLSAVVEGLKAKNEFNSGILPPAVRYLSPDRDVVVFERPPMQQLIEFIPAKREIAAAHAHQKRSYLLNIPWTVYVACLGDYRPTMIRCFVRNQPLGSMHDHVGMIPLLNFYNSSTLCNPVYEKYEGEVESLAEGINLAYNMVWNSGWNFDLSDALVTSAAMGVPWMVTNKNHVKLIQAWHEYWAKLSMDDVLKLKWMTPGSVQNNTGSLNDPMTLETAIAYAQKEVQRANEASLTNKFLVDLAGVIV